MTNRSFSLTHPTPSKQAPRSESFQKRDYASEAITHWLDAQLVSDDLDTAVTNAAMVSDRLTNGDAWLREHGPSSPDWTRANELHVRLCSEQMHGLHRIKALYVQVWLRCCDVFGCLSQLEDAARWIQKHADGAWQHDHPRSIWKVLQPNRKMPFSQYPAPLDAHSVEHNFLTHESLTKWMHRDRE